MAFGISARMTLSNQHHRIWKIHPGSEEAVRPFLGAPDEIPPGLASTIIKENSARRVFRYSKDGSPVVYLKLFRLSGGLAAARFLARAAKSTHEFEMLVALRANGIAVPEPLGSFERKEGGRLVEAGLLTRALPDGVAGDEALRDERDPAVRRELLRRMGETIRRLTEIRFVHRDLHAGNFHVVSREAGGRDLFLLDVHRADYLCSRAEPVNLLRAMAPFFYNSLTRVTHRLERIRFLRDLVGRDTVRAMQKESRRVGEKHHRSRTKRCLVESSRFTVERTPDRTVYRLREFPPEALEQALRGHEASIQGKNAGVFKTLPDRVVTRQSVELTGVGGGSVPRPGRPSGRGTEAPPTASNEALSSRWIVGVKEFRYRFLRALANRLVRSPGLRSWVNGVGLDVRHVPTPRPLAFVVYPDGRERLVTEWIDGAWPLNDFLKRSLPLCTLDLRRELIRRIAGEVRRLHLVAGVDHGDLKANNLLVGPDAQVRFLDLDRVKFRGVVPMDRRWKALAQLNGAVTPPLTRQDRLHFLACYAVYETGPWHHRKETVRRIMAMTAARRHLWP